MRDLNRYQADYQALPFEATQAHYRRKHLLDQLARFKPANILEVGCGMEPLFLHHSGFEHLFVIEPAAAFHAHATEAAHGRPDVQVLAGTLQDLAPSLSGQTFDCIVLSSVLHEVPVPAELLTAALSLCGNDSIVHVYVPNANSLHRLLALEMGLIADLREISATQQRMQQGIIHDRQSLAQLLEQSGFEVLESGSVFIKPFTHAQMAAMQQQGVLTQAMLDGLYRLSRHLPDMGSELYALARRKPQA